MSTQLRDRQKNEPLFGGPGSAEHAVVIGGSMGGLFAARILSDHFDRVTIVDRDAFPEEPDHRKGVPQSHHAHAVLARGQEVIEQLFPGYVAEVNQAGAKAGGKLSLVAPFGKLAEAEQGEGNSELGEGTFLSRFLLEWTIRRRVAALKGVRFISSTEVMSLVSTPDGSRVTGVNIRRRDKDKDLADITPEVLEADLIVDASGRRSKAPQWLEELGYDAPPEETINSGLGYASRFYEKPDNFPDEWDGIIINSRPPHNPRAGLILPIEDGKWHVTVGGYAGNYPPLDEEGFLQWAKDLPDPSIYESIRVAKPITPIRGYRTPTNRLRHFEKIDRRPEQFIATGDSVCAFNPIYGQGMTTSALDSLVLKESLRQQKRRPEKGFEGRFQEAIADTVAGPWSVATGEDLRWEGVKIDGAPSGMGTKLQQSYTNLVLKRAVEDSVLSKAYQDVVQMMDRPTSLFKPALALRVLREALTSKDRTELANAPALSPRALADLRSRPEARFEFRDAS